MSGCPELLKPSEICGPEGTMDKDGILGNYLAFLFMEATNDSHWQEFGDKLLTFIGGRGKRGSK